MEFHGFKLDFAALAMLVTALTGAYSTWQGMKARKKKAGTETERLPLPPKKEVDKDGSDAQ